MVEGTIWISIYKECFGDCWRCVLFWGKLQQALGEEVSSFLEGAGSSVFLSILISFCVDFHLSYFYP